MRKPNNARQARSKPCALIQALERRSLLSFTAPADPRITTSLDASWKFIRQDVTGAAATAFNDSTWTTIDVPHTWNALDGQDGGSNYYRGIGWYRKHIAIPANETGKELYLKFDGANLVTDLYVNGTSVGEHRGGYSAFGWDITPYVTVGSDNVLAVKVNNATDANIAPLGGDYTMDGGIYRHVNLIATNVVHVATQEYVPPDTSASPIGPTVGYFLNTPGVYLTPTNVSSTSANLKIATDLRNDSAAAQTVTVISDIVDASGTLVQELSSDVSVPGASNINALQNTVIANPHLWNGVKDPYQYSVYVSVQNAGATVDVMRQPLGFRYYGISPTTGFSLNGQPYDLHGVSLHQDRLNEGWAVSDADQRQDISMVKDIGATFVRLSHYQHAPLTYDLLDADGIAAWSEIPFNGTNNSGATNSTSFLDNLKQQLQEMIRQNYNHPAVVVWGLFNELDDNSTTQANVATLNALAHQEDPTRLTTGASNQSNTAAINTITNAVGFNKYYGWYGGVVTDLGPALDAAHAAKPNSLIGVSEYGAGASINQHQENPPIPANAGTFHPEEYQDLYHESSWNQLEARPYVWAKLVWNMFDFAVDSRSEGDTAGRNDKGLVTYDRATPKDSYYFYRANWSADPTLYLASKRFTTRTTSPTTIKVYSNLANVSVSLNGINLGTLAGPNNPDHVYTWSNVSLKSGNNTVVVTTTTNGKTYTDSAIWNYTALQTIPALTGTPFARINFGTAASPAVSGYLLDSGTAYGSRNGLTYGWNATNTANGRYRTSGYLATPPDSRYSTLIQMQASGTFTWSIAVPNGVYDVHLAAGDPSYTDSVDVLNLEGLVALSGTPTTAKPWLENIVRVTVADGQLTLTNGSGSTNDKVDYIDINTADVTPPTVTSSTFNYQAGQSIQYQFSENIAGFAPTAIQLHNNTTNQDIDPTKLAVSVNGRAAVITFPGFPAGLPDGVYSATLLAAGVSDIAGNPLSQNAGFNFFSLAGDANRDGKVDVIDLGILSSNWQMRSTTWSTGDFNNDGIVDVVDLGILSSNWQKTLDLTSLTASTAIHLPAVTKVIAKRV